MEPPRVEVQFDLICATSGQTDRSNRWAPAAPVHANDFVSIYCRGTSSACAHTGTEKEQQGRDFSSGFWFEGRPSAFAVLFYLKRLSLSGLLR